MNYKTYKPKVDLRPFIKFYWTLKSSGKIKPEKQRIVPDGCMEMIFHYGDLFKQYYEGEKL